MPKKKTMVKAGSVSSLIDAPGAKPAFTGIAKSLTERPLFDAGGCATAPELPIDVPDSYLYGGIPVESIKKIDYAPVTFLYPGHTTGGCLGSTMSGHPRGPEVEYISAHREDRIAPAFFDRHPEMVRKFERLIDNCCDTQRGTRKLYTRLSRQERQLERNVNTLQQKLKIMRSMPDISMPRKEFQLFVGNAMTQQRAMDDEMAKELDEFMSNKRVGSIRHIFPLRDTTGRIAANSGDALRWRNATVAPDNLLGRVSGGPDPYDAFLKPGKPH
jgi:hypothetical protein